MDLLAERVCYISWPDRNYGPMKTPIARRTSTWFPFVKLKSSHAQQSRLNSLTSGIKMKAMKHNHAVNPASPTNLSFSHVEGESIDQGLLLSGDEGGDSVSKAFSSMVYMIRVLQSHVTSEMVHVLEVQQEVVQLVQRELHSSFLWLFQRVFFCTPTLMLSIMLLLADFTAFSTHRNIHAVPVPHCNHVTCKLSKSSLPRDGHSGSGCEGDIKGSENPGFLLPGDNAYSVFHAERKSMFEDSKALADPPPMATSCNATKPGGRGVINNNNNNIEGIPVSSSTTVWKKVQDAVIIRRNAAGNSDGGMSHVDDYGCYDRTEVMYQYAMNGTQNAMILANYARFLHLVRHDIHRSKQAYQDALRVDPYDGEILVQLANLLWLEHHDNVGAEQAYEDAMAMDPNNPFIVGDYAHFLWHQGDKEEN